MIFDIVKGAKNSILRAVSAKHEKVTKKTLKLLKDMEETMIFANGVGIAAPQIGLNTRVVHITINKDQTFPMINPEILSMSEKTETETEGCLSLPGKWGPVARAKELTVRFTTPSGSQTTMKFTGFEARIVQHEVDHLNGKLFIDHVPEGKLEENVDKK